MPTKLTHVHTTRALLMAEDMGFPIYVKPLHQRAAHLYAGTPHIAHPVKLNIAMTAISDRSNVTVWVDHEVVQALESALALAGDEQ